MRISNSVYCILLLISFNSNLFAQNNVSAVPAAPYPLEILQSDGSKIQVLGNGDERFHYKTTLDGYCIVKNISGVYEYAKSNEENLIVPSGIKASDPEDRVRADSEFLDNLDTEAIKKSILEEQTQNEILKSISIVSDINIDEAFPTTGDRKVLILLIEYPDLDNTYTNADFDNLMNQLLTEHTDHAKLSIEVGTMMTPDMAAP